MWSALRSPIAAALELPAGSQIYRLRRLRLVEGEIIGLEDRAMPERIGSAMSASALVTRPATRIVETALGTPLGGMTVSVGAMAAPDRNRARACPSAAAIRCSCAATPSSTSRAGRCSPGSSIYRGDKYRFTYGYRAGRRCRRPSR